jgi:hypothetical protein
VPEYILQDKKLTQNDIIEIEKEYSIDLIAYYKVLEAAIFELMDKAQKDGWTPEKLLKEVDKLFDDKGIVAKPKTQDLTKHLENIIKKLTSYKKG